MSTNITLQLETADQNPLFSRVFWSPIDVPSVYSGSIIGGESLVYDINYTQTSLTIDNLVPGLYEMRAQGGATNTLAYFQIPDLGGGTGNAADYLVNTFPSGSQSSTASYAYNAGTASYALTAATSLTSVSASYAVTASYAENAGSNYPNIYDVDGNVGISQPSPQYILDVNGVIGNSNGGDYLINIGTNNSYLNANGGNVGVGTISPAYVLDVNGNIGNSNGDLNLIGLNNANLSANSGNIAINADGGNGFIFLDSSAVGVNQPTPAYVLDVLGNINCTTGYYLNGAPYTSSAVQAPSIQLYDNGLARYVTVTCNNGILHIA